MKVPNPFPAMSEYACGCKSFVSRVLRFFRVIFSCGPSSVDEGEKVAQMMPQGATAGSLLHRSQEPTGSPSA